MRRFYQKYQNQQTVSVKLSWSHYCELLSISDDDKRSFYEHECINARWSFRELKRQIDSSLFERLLLSDGQGNKQKVMQLATKGVEMTQPSDIIKDPYVFEFVGIPENKPIMESDLERMLVRGIEDFLLELGRGFMFVGTQQRVTLNNTHYYVDMVFYNKILKDRCDKESSLGHYNSMNVMSMHALLGAYKPEGYEWVEELRQVITGNVDFACKYIEEHFDGVTVSRPQGTYMLFVDCAGWLEKHGKTIDELKAMFYDVGVMVQDGRQFQAPTSLRMNLALPLSRVQEAFDRLGRYVFTP